MKKAPQVTLRLLLTTYSLLLTSKAEAHEEGPTTARSIGVAHPLECAEAQPLVETECSDVALMHLQVNPNRPRTAQRL